MYVGKVSLENLRGFQSLDFDLARPGQGYAGWTVFTGDNGSGKSALLKAIAIGLIGRDAAHALQPSFRRWIRDGSSEASIRLDIVRIEGDDGLAESGQKPGASFPAKLILRNGNKEPTLGVATPEGKPERYKTPERTIWSTDAAGWFSCGYGPFRRVSGHSTDAQRLMTAPSTERFVTMFQEAASLAEVAQWLRSLKHKELENRAAEKEQLALLLEILGDDLMPNQITVDRVDSDGLWLRDRNGVQLSWAEMSDGYRAALALLADIMRHLIAAYGPEGITARDDQGKVFVARSGVVLIDEVDAHLHPEWLLLCCSDCGRFKGTRFPLDQEGRPLLVDPSAEDPWQFLDFDPVTGNITARFEVASNSYSAKGEETVVLLQLDQRQALSDGYTRTWRRLAKIVASALGQGAPSSADLVAELREVDDHGLLE